MCQILTSQDKIITQTQRRPFLIKAMRKCMIYVKLCKISTDIAARNIHDLEGKGVFLSLTKHKFFKHFSSFCTFLVSLQVNW